MIYKLLQTDADYISLFLRIIIGQSIGSIALLPGFLGRIAAGANIIIFAGALIVHAPDGWAMNWLGKKKGEGVEYFVMLLSILLVIFIKGSGPLSIDHWLLSKMKCQSLKNERMEH